MKVSIDNIKTSAGKPNNNRITEIVKELRRGGQPPLLHVCRINKPGEDDLFRCVGGEANSLLRACERSRRRDVEIKIVDDTVKKSPAETALPPDDSEVKANGNADQQAESAPPSPVQKPIQIPASLAVLARVARKQNEAALEEKRTVHAADSALYDIRPKNPSDVIELTKLAKQHYQDAKQSAQNTFIFAVRCGERLLEIKGLVGHGNWLPWLKRNRWMPERTASRYIRYAERKDEILALLKSANLAEMTMVAADNLLAPPKNESAITNATSNGALPNSTTSLSEKRIKVASAALHDCEPIERRRVLADPTLELSEPKSPTIIDIDAEPVIDAVTEVYAVPTAENEVNSEPPARELTAAELEQQEFDRLNDAWHKASEPARERFVSFIYVLGYSPPALATDMTKATTGAAE